MLWLLTHNVTNIVSPMRKQDMKYVQDGKEEKHAVQEGEGVSRDDIAAALLEVTAGRIPLDRIALRELAQEVKTWPYLDAEDQLEAEKGTASNYEGITDTGPPLPPSPSPQ